MKDKKERKREYEKKWRAEHPEKVKQYEQTRREKHKEERRQYFREWKRKNREQKSDIERERDREYRRQYYQKNKEKILARKREYYARTRNERLAYHKKWREEHPESVKTSYEKDKEKRRTPEYRKKNRDWARKRNRRKKEEVVKKLGGKCQRCGYNKYYGALELHHIERKKEPFRLWRKEMSLEGLILLCCRCHRELHAEEGTVGKDPID